VDRRDALLVPPGGDGLALTRHAIPIISLTLLVDLSPAKDIQAEEPNT